MAWLNQLLDRGDLAKLTQDERDFIVGRLESQLDFNPKIAAILADEVSSSLEVIGKQDIAPRVSDSY
jgi:hypothetical protein